MTYASVADRDAIQNEMAWEDRDLPVTTYAMLSQTTAKFPDRKALSFQLMSGPADKCETYTWSELKDKTTQTANMFRALGVGENDVVAYLLPNANETVLSFLGGQVAGIVNPINPLLDATQIAAILRETNAKVLVTLRAFPKTDVAQKAAEAVYCSRKKMCRCAPCRCSMCLRGSYRLVRLCHRARRSCFRHHKAIVAMAYSTISGN